MKNLQQYLPQPAKIPERLKFNSIGYCIVIYVFLFVFKLLSNVDYVTLRVAWCLPADLALILAFAECDLIHTFAKL
ncbi:MAG: hypothetical protein ACRDBI_11695 [Shewanella sp.]